MFFKPFGQFFRHQAFDHRPHFRRDEFVFGLGREFRIRHFHRQDASQPFARIVARDRDFLPLGDTAFGGIFVDDPCQRTAKSSKVGPAIALGDIIGEAQNILVIAVIPFHRGFDGDPVFFSNRIDRFWNLRRAGAVEMFDKGFHPALIFEHNLPRRAGFAQITEQDFHAGVQEGQFAQTVFECLTVIFDHGERAGRCQKAHRCAGINAFAVFALGAVTLLDQGRFGKAAIDEAAIMFFAVAVDREVEPV